MREAAVADFVPTHRPVLAAETLEALDPGPGKVLLDGTVGLGGHAARWLELTAPFGRVVGFDRDARALAVAARNLAPFGARAELIHDDYREAPRIIAERGFAAPDAALLDLGLGSHQIDDPTRGFSHRFDAPLDMRFDADAPGRTAADILARAAEPELARIFEEHGELPGARKLARALCDARRRAPIRTTTELARLVREVLPPRGRQRIDPATLVFQALRIAVNDELEGLDAAIEALVRMLPQGGRIAVIAFHSLEDRIAKRTLRRLAEPCRCRRGDPCTCGATRLLDMPERRAVKTSDEEALENPRARSARLRWGTRR